MNFTNFAKVANLEVNQNILTAKKIFYAYKKSILVFYLALYFRHSEKTGDATVSSLLPWQPQQPHYKQRSLSVLARTCKIFLFRFLCVFLENIDLR